LVGEPLNWGDVLKIKKRIGIMGLALVIVFVFGTVVVASASGPEYIYKVEGAKLEAGKTQEVTGVKAATAFFLRGESSGVKATIECTTLKANAASEPLIAGGQPGTSSKGQLELSSCGAVVGGETCKTAKIGAIPVTSEIVTVVAPAAKAGDLATLVTTTGAIVKLTECGAFGNVEVEVRGDAGALNSAGEAKVGTETFTAGTNLITKVKTFGGAPKEVLLEFGGNFASLEGEAELQLKGGKKWGVA
jgi:hypothetical protein